MLAMHIIDTVIILAHDQNISFKYGHVLYFQKIKLWIYRECQMTRCIHVETGRQPWFKFCTMTKNKVVWIE